MPPEIRTLETLTVAEFGRVAPGYTSLDRYLVTREETNEGIAFHLKLTQLLQPFVKRWELTPVELARYRVVLAQKLSLGAYDGDELVALAIAERRDWNRSLWVWEFHVAPRYQRQGIGRRLMEALAQRARDAGLHTLVCETQSTNVPAIRFYRGLGFTLDGLDLSYYGPDEDAEGEVAFFMKREL